jgi:hypothetical protein
MLDLRPRQFFTLLASAAAVWSHAGQAQQPATAPRQFNTYDSALLVRIELPFVPVERRALATPSWLLAASKRCLECDGGS